MRFSGRAGDGVGAPGARVAWDGRVLYDGVMAIYLDDEAVDLPGEDLGAVLAAARDRLEPEGRVVVEVAMEGQTLDAQALEQQDQIPVVDGAEVRLYTADPVELSVETLGQVRTALAHAGELQADAADLLQRDDADTALGKVAEAVQVWLQVQQAVLHAALLAEVELDELNVAGEPVSGYTDELIARLTELRDAIQAHDTVALADTLAYEWPDIVDRWDRVIGALIDEIRA
jgi:hypothetical protein